MRMASALAGHTDRFGALSNAATSARMEIRQQPILAWRAGVRPTTPRTRNSLGVLRRVGKLVMQSDSADNRYAAVTFDRDALGNLVEVAYFGPSGEPVYVQRGYARVKRMVDTAGEMMKKRISRAPASR